MAWVKVKDDEGREHLVPENALKDIFPKGIFRKVEEQKDDKGKKQTGEQKR